MSSEDTLLRTILVVLAVILLVPFLMMVFMMPVMGLWGWGHMWNVGVGDTTGATWIGLLVWLIMLAVVGGVVYLLYRFTRSPAEQETDPALEELRTAYARGELTDEEFEERRERLRRDR